MSLGGPIILIEDDQNDSSVITDAIRAIGVENEVIAFVNPEKAFDYLVQTSDQPFFILSDIKLPGMDGLTFRQKINEHKELKKKGIPFVFLTGFVTQDIINRAFVELNVQGFYEKEKSFDKLKTQLLTISMYWKYSLHPNKEI